MNEQKRLDICGEISTVETYLRDLQVLSQDILEDFFEKYQSGDKALMFDLMYETPRYASLFRILDLRIRDIHKRIAALEDSMLKKNDRRDSSSNGQ